MIAFTGWVTLWTIDHVMMGEYWSGIMGNSLRLPSLDESGDPRVVWVVECSLYPLVTASLLLWSIRPQADGVVISPWYARSISPRTVIFRS